MPRHFPCGTSGGPLFVKLTSLLVVVASAILLGILGMPMACSQPPTAVQGAEMVELNFAGATTLPKLLEAFSKILDTRFIYGADMENRPVNVVTPTTIPKDAIKPFLGSILKSQNLAIVDSAVPGWKRIEDRGDFKPFAAIGSANEILARDGPAAVVTQVLEAKNLNIAQLKPQLDKFKSVGGEILTLDETGVIIVTDYTENVQKIADLIRLIDQARTEAIIDFYEVKNRTPASLIEQVEALLSKNGGGAVGEVRLFNDASGKRVVVAGDRNRVARVLQLLQQLDTGTDFMTRLYRVQNVSVSRLDTIIKGLVSSEELEKAIETTVDEEGNLLIVRAPEAIHAQIKRLLQELDQPINATESPYQFYKLRNANAMEVLFTLLALQQVTGTGQGFPVGGLGMGAFGTLGGMNMGGVNPMMGFGGFPGMGGMGMGRMGIGNQPMQMPPGADFGDNSIEERRPNANQNSALGALIGGVAGMGGIPGGLGTGMVGFGGGQVATLPGGARVTADVATNSLIVYAPASVQPLYERLIRSLDQRRPQVMIEAEIIAVDTSDNFALGVEISFGDRQGARRLFKFTSFGLSEVDPLTGALSVNPSLGFNGVLVDPDVADVIVQALARHTRSRVLASPKILVNDNQTGSLESVNSVPFQSVNASDTVATTSLGGNQQAGTIITVTPHINEDDHLQLEFDVEFSTFAGSGGTADLPPPRQIDRITSVVTIPNGDTIVVGGLKRIGDSDSFTGIPWAEKIPILRELTSLSTETRTTTSFFLFIRPKILRDSRFRDLRYLSDLEAQAAQIEGDAPRSGPLLIQCPKPLPSKMIP